MTGVGTPTHAEILDRVERGLTTWQDAKALKRHLEAQDQFVKAFDAWAASDELCGGPLFDAMLAARDSVGG